MLHFSTLNLAGYISPYCGFIWMTFNFLVGWVFSPSPPCPDHVWGQSLSHAVDGTLSFPRS